jgi:hypothetical protein
MYCNWCNKEIENKFGTHINSSHHSNLTEYFAEFPEQKSELKKQVPWCKGLTAKDHPSIARIASKVKEWTNQEFVKQERSDRLKKRYEAGDILDKETRAAVVKAGTTGWVDKIKNCSLEERIELLKNFTTAGNDAQEERRPLLTPDDYKKLYPWAKGQFGYSKCDWCKNEIVICSGGDTEKPRALTNFCDNSCRAEYRAAHPNVVIGGRRFKYFSDNLGKEVLLMSMLEEFVVRIFDANKLVWDICPFHIDYEYQGKNCKYYPDFLVRGKTVLEVKSDFVFNLDGGKTACKLEAANKWCLKNGYVFEYWEFGTRNYTRKKIENDPRVKKLLLATGCFGVISE